MSGCVVSSGSFTALSLGGVSKLVCSTLEFSLGFLNVINYDHMRQKKHRLGHIFC